MKQENNLFNISTHQENEIGCNNDKNEKIHIIEMLNQKLEFAKMNRKEECIIRLNQMMKKYNENYKIKNNIQPLLNEIDKGNEYLMENSFIQNLQQKIWNKEKNKIKKIQKLEEIMQFYKNKYGDILFDLNYFSKKQKEILFYYQNNFIDEKINNFLNDSSPVIPNYQHYQKNKSLFDQKLTFTTNIPNEYFTIE